MAFNKITYSNNFYEENKNFVFDGSICIQDTSTLIYRDPLNKELYFRDPSTGPISLTELANPTSLNANMGPIVYVSENGDENGQKGNPLKPFDISSAVNVVAAQGDLIYVYAGDYLLEQSLTPRDINVWNFYFQPAATVDFGDVSLGPFGSVIGEGGSLTYVYGHGNFIARRSVINNSTVRILEFNQIIAAGSGISQGIMSGNVFTMEDNANISNYFFQFFKYSNVKDIFIYKATAGATASYTKSVIFFDRIFSNTSGLQLSNAGSEYQIYGGSIDSSNNGIKAVNTGSGKNSTIIIKDVSVFGSGSGIDAIGDGSYIKVDKILTNTGSGIQLGASKDIVIEASKVISSANYAINNDVTTPGSTKYKISYIESLSTHALVHQFRNNTTTKYKTIYDIDEIRCPSTSYGIYCRTVGINAEYEAYFKNSFISARYPIYLNISLTGFDNARMYFSNMQLYSETGEESVYAVQVGTPAKFTDVWANTDPHANLLPLWDGIKVSDRIYPS